MALFELRVSVLMVDAVFEIMVRKFWVPFDGEDVWCPPCPPTSPGGEDRLHENSNVNECGMVP